jgi:hypothetical protein
MSINIAKRPVQKIFDFGFISANGFTTYYLSYPIEDKSRNDLTLYIIDTFVMDKSDDEPKLRHIEREVSPTPQAVQGTITLEKPKYYFNLDHEPLITKLKTRIAGTSWRPGKPVSGVYTHVYNFLTNHAQENPDVSPALWLEEALREHKAYVVLFATRMEVDKSIKFTYSTENTLTLKSTLTNETSS